MTCILSPCGTSRSWGRDRPGRPPRCPRCAADRTLLAWVRTALTLLAAGVAVQQLADGSTGLALGLLLTGGAAVVAGGVRYRAADLAIRAGRLPAQGRAPYVLVTTVALLAVAAVVLVLLRAS